MAKQRSDDRPERVPSAAKINQLTKQSISLRSKLAADRGAFGSKIKEAAKSDGLNERAFAIASGLFAIPDDMRRSSTVRHLLLYIDHLGLNAQADIEDAIESSAASNEGEKITPQGADPIAHVLDGDGFDQGASERELELTLAHFRDAIAEAADIAQVKRALNVWTQDHTGLSGELADIANARIADLRGSRPGRTTKEAADAAFH